MRGVILFTILLVISTQNVSACLRMLPSETYIDGVDPPNIQGLPDSDSDTWVSTFYIISWRYSQKYLDDNVT